MATPPIVVRNSERRLYLLVAVLFPLIVLIGFARTYYLKGFFAAPALPGRLVHIHGLVMTAWVTLFVVQVGLVARRRTRAHQRLGMFGAALALVVFCVGILTAIDAAVRGSAPPGLNALQFLIVPLGDMLVFGVLIGVALYYRRKMAIHKRLMVVAAISMLPPAIARIPLQFIQENGAIAFFGLADLILIACVAFDTMKNRKLHPAFLWGGLFVILSHPVRLLLAPTDAWVQIATAIVSLAR